MAAVALSAVVVQLGEYLRFILGDGAADFTVAVDSLRFPGIDELFIGVVGGMDGLLLGDDKACTASGPLRQVVHVAPGREIVIGEIGKVGGKGDAVGDGYFAYLEGGKKVF